MKIKDKLILALILMLFSVTAGIGAVRYLLKGGDIVRFDLITRYGVDSMGRDGLDGDDTQLYPLYGTTALTVCQGNDARIPTTDEKAAMTGANSPSAANVFATMTDTSPADSGVQIITAGVNLTNSGTEKQPILDVDDVFYTKTAADLLLLDKADTPHDHNNLYYTETEADALLLDKADTPHAHDDRYYTESESDALLLDKADTPHDHDDRYYTETELDAGQLDTRYYTETEADNLLADKVALADSALHQHVEADITDLDKYSQSEVDTLLLDKVALADSDLHTHTESDITDLDKYTQAEVDSALSGKVAQADSALHYHNDEYGLQGGTAGEYYHLTNAKYEMVDASAEDSYLDAGQKAAIDLNTADRHASASDNQNLWEEIRTDTGTTSANSQTDTLWITGGTDIMVTNSGDTIIIDYTGTGGGATAWGDITGTLSAQTDLEARFTNAWKERRFNAFRIGNYANMIDGFTNDFTVEDEGIDTVLSDTYLYDATGDYYYQKTGITTTLDMMEYDSDDSAQANYISSDTHGAEAKDQECTGGSSNEYFGHSTRGKFIYQSFLAGATGKVTKFTTDLKIGAGSPDGTLTGYLYDNNGGVPGNLLSTLSNFSASTLTSSYVVYNFTEAFADAYAIQSGTTYHIVIGYSKIDDSNYIHVAVGGTYADGNHGYGEIDSWTAQDNDQNFATYVTPLDNLQCYSSTTKTQGTYSLKIEALKDASLADTMYHVFDPVIDLTGKTSIKLDTRATITGQNFSIKIHDSGGTTTTHAVTIADTDVYQTDTWDISGVATADKDAIDKMIIEIDLAGATNTFYLDNVFGELPAGGNMNLYTSQNYNIGLVPTTVRAMVLSNAEPTSVSLSRTGTGTSMTAGVLADSDVYNSTYYSFNYSADVSAESSDTCIRCEITADTSVIHVFGLSLIGLE